ncbi:MAG: MBOAT family O-acyltransferase [Clostridia bacterium]|nr:MBOAT family O-acyltransferase [Clostridia bacterium]
MYYFSYLYLPVFLGLTVLAYFFTPIKKRWVVLLIASLIFYLYNVRNLSVYILVTAVSIYIAALWLDKIDACAALARKHLLPDERAWYKDVSLWQKKAVIALLVLIDFGLLAWMKYSGFGADSADHLLKLMHMDPRLPSWSLGLPLGISFYTLQAVSYVVDVYRGKAKANQNFGQVLLFVCFFPQIVEGPIGRYDHLAPQLYEGHRFDYRNFTGGLQLILWGLLKKIVIADRAYILVNQVFSHDRQYSGAGVVLAILLYTLELYADFSGCIDVATGSAQIMGIHMAQNFRRPFFSKSVNEFWRRWHITLGAWLRDYIFYPVSLSKPLMKFSRFIRRKHNTHFGKWILAGSSLFFVWLGNGLWHGAGWKYLVYGMYYYVLMMMGMLLEPVFRKMFATLHLNREGVPHRLFQVARTFVLVNIGMLIFRAASLRSAAVLFLSMFRGPYISAITKGSLLKLGLSIQDLLVLGAGALVLFVVGLLQERGISLREKVGRWPLPARWSVYLAAIFVLVIFGAYGSGYVPVDPIYAKF